MTPTLTGIHHVTLSVTDGKRSAEWYGRVLGFERAAIVPMETFDRIVLRHPDGLLMTLVTHHERSGDSFDEHRTGLDHLAFAVADPAAVEAWAAHVDALGVRRSEVKSGALAGSRLFVFRDPDGIQLECYCSD
jgi:catechol 2,3-dioxygenase-like lactoylglutathione lyase family enzyme